MIISHSHGFLRHFQQQYLTHLTLLSHYYFIEICFFKQPTKSHGISTQIRPNWSCLTLVNQPINNSYNWAGIRHHFTWRIHRLLLYTVELNLMRRRPQLMNEFQIHSRHFPHGSCTVLCWGAIQSLHTIPTKLQLLLTVWTHDLTRTVKHHTLINLSHAQQKECLNEIWI